MINGKRFLVSLVQKFSNFWTRLNNVSGFVSGELFFYEAICHFPRKSARKKKNSVVSFTHKQNKAKTQLDDIAH